MRPLLLAACLALALVAVGCRAGPKEARSLPPGIGPPTFLIQAFDARGTLLLGAPEGVFRSVDAGASWGRAPRRVWGALSAGFTPGSTIVTRGRLFQRGDLSFDHVNLPQRAPFGGGTAVGLAWLHGGKLYALVRGTRSRLYVTVDSARTWFGRPAIGLPRHVRQIAAMRAGDLPDVLFAAAGDQGLWRSVDAGVTWHRLRGAGRTALAVCTTAARRGRVLVAGPRVRWSDDYGATWHATRLRASLLAGDPRNGNVFFAVDLDGKLRASSDGGRTW